MPEPKRRGRPKMTDAEKAEAQMKRLQQKLEDAKEPTPPPIKGSNKNGGEGGKDKAEIASNLIKMARKGMKLPRVDTFDADAIMKRFELYLGECEQNGIVPSMEGLYNWLGISRNAWWMIINRVDGHIRSDEVVSTLEQIKTVMGEIVSGASDAGLINTAISVLKMTNSFGYKDVKQVEHTNEVNVQIGMSDVKALVDKYGADQVFIDSECVPVDDSANSEDTSPPDAL